MACEAYITLATARFSSGRPPLIDALPYIPHLARNIQQSHSLAPSHSPLRKSPYYTWPLSRDNDPRTHCSCLASSGRHLPTDYCPDSEPENPKNRLPRIQEIEDFGNNPSPIAPPRLPRGDARPLRRPPSSPSSPVRSYPVDARVSHGTLPAATAHTPKEIPLALPRPPRGNRDLNPANRQRTDSFRPSILKPAPSTSSAT